MTAKCPAHHRVGEAGGGIAGYNLNTVHFINMFRFPNFVIQIRFLRSTDSTSSKQCEWALNPAYGPNLIAAFIGKGVQNQRE